MERCLTLVQRYRPKARFPNQFKTGISLHWDAQSLGPVRHREILSDFLQSFLPVLHAIELNGMRSQKENREVLQLGDALNVPVISGGDRHGCEANAVLNLSQAGSFEEFVHEIRCERRSEVLLMPQFFEPLPIRLVENAWHALSDAPGSLDEDTG